MILRFVTLRVPRTAAAGFATEVLPRVRPINEAAGAALCRVLRREEEGGAVFAVVSLWEDGDRLAELKESPRYGALLEAMARYGARLSESLWEVVG